MQITTVVGIVVAAVIVLFGLILIFRKPNDAAPSLESELQLNAETQLPIIPRHVRDQLQLAAEAVAVDVATEPAIAVPDAGQAKTTAATEVQVEASSPDATVFAQAGRDEAQAERATTPETSAAVADASIAVEESTTIQSTAIDSTATPSSVFDSTTVTRDSGAALPTQSNDSLSTQTATVTAATQDSASSTDDVLSFQLNPNIETAEIADFEEESSILDKHLHEQRRFDDESTLANAETLIALNVYPNPRRALSGDKTLKLLLKYGLRFGELSCFHRYENTEEVSPLMFSVLRITDEGPTGFDLESLSGEQVQGLAFFLALPHRNVQKGFDTMVSIAGLIAREIDGAVYDENNLEFTPQLKEHWRHKAIDYRAGQAL
ncbi:cell division protein ZipA C-terminal FtsZ-binding domain-containing protein [Acinetobacter larvae]|uniref:Cell division protein ZipA n=1 Tax=Acinetobacter larvae TaxID=1789224 RepID=A0A1B2LX16_9GAMM|nr:cell division protein ZipA C-terminal FtsZ-binding domain-containing protein [Acinetobacter larvae]AOA57429.1 cell division protein ZipA [Acinetobacter larvae]